MNNIGKTFAGIMGFIIIIILAFSVVGAVWWVVLWSFNFPIAFAWKQVIGVLALSALFNSGSIKD